MFSKNGRTHTDRHALLGTQHLRAETPGPYQGLHLVPDDMTYRPAMLLLQVVLAMRDIDAQPAERLQGRVGGFVPTAFLPLGERLVGFATAASASATASAPETRGGDLVREDGELVRKVLGAEVAVEHIVRPAGRPRTFYEDGGERGGYLGRCGAPDGDGLRRGREAVRGDVAEEEELLAGGVVPDEEGRGLVVAQRVVLAVQHGHRPDRNIGEDRPVALVER